ncbi:MAG TPA: conjugative transfer system coupling protein TraD [Burkholderiaceae bacterium]|nr:conjugative transfer system coupling protein TraD [Burkholderiaceae bacterium]
MLMRQYEMPWRRAYEIWPAVAWLLGLPVLVYFSGTGVITPAVATGLCLLAGLLACLRTWQAFQVLRLRGSLTGRPMQIITTAQHAKLTGDPDQLFLGFGFEWLPVHSQRLYEMSKVDYRDYALGPIAKRIVRGANQGQPESEIGMPWIHGVEPREKLLYRPVKNFEGGTLLVGTTQAGKGVALANLITQAVRRGDIVVIIDPKNSHRLKQVVERACADYREPGTFTEFHPAFPERGVRVDFLYSWGKATELASRIQSIMPLDTGGAFHAFGWDAVNVVVQAMVALEERPNLRKIMQYIEAGIDPLLQRSLERLLEQRLGLNWREDQALRKLLENQNTSRGSPVNQQLAAYVAYYERHIPAIQRDKVIDSQIRVHRHNREHYQKITANLLPILSMLTSGELGRSLSPDPFDLEDTRPILNFEKIERSGHVLYMCLDSLPDPAVASAIGALAISDLAARAGMRYNLGTNTRRLSLFVDEISNVINQPLIELLNKGAEAGVYSICAMQTLADLAERMGSEHAARKALGNLNNMFALRSKDRMTQDFIVETFGRTGIHAPRVSMNEGADTHLGDWSSGRSVTLTESMEERVPAEVLGVLPNLQYFGLIAGRLLKGRFPIMSPDHKVA